MNKMFCWQCTDTGCWHSWKPHRHVSKESRATIMEEHAAMHGHPINVHVWIEHDRDLITVEAPS